MPKLRQYKTSLIHAIRELYYWQHSEDSTSFNALLFLLFQKADFGNLARLKRGFPDHYNAWRLWKNSPSQSEFFKFWLGDEFCKERFYGRTDRPN